MAFPTLGDRQEALCELGADVEPELGARCDTLCRVQSPSEGLFGPQNIFKGLQM